MRNWKNWVAALVMILMMNAIYFSAWFDARSRSSPEETGNEQVETETGWGYIKPGDLVRDPNGNVRLVTGVATGEGLRLDFAPHSDVFPIYMMHQMDYTLVRRGDGLSPNPE